jgi:hypothetical protein
MLKAALLKTLSCPVIRAISAPSAESQMRAVLSEDAVTMRVPSGLNAEMYTSSS